MSRCKACNVILSQEEETIVYEFGEPINMCINCIRESDIGVMMTEEDYYSIEDEENDS